MPQLPLTCLAIIGCGLLSGCATIIKGTTQAVPVASEPAGAQVIVDGQPAGTTPTTVTLARKHSHLISVQLSGYEVENVSVTNSVGGAVAGNIIAGGLVGWGVDATSGAQYNLYPETVNVRLRPRGTTGPVFNRASGLAAELGRLDDMRAKGRLSNDEYTALRSALLADYEKTEVTGHSPTDSSSAK